MEGYKAFESDWSCRGFQYEIGKIYELPEDEKLKICECGFHFCKNPIDVFGYYDFKDDIRVAEVEAFGEIQQDGTKYVTDKIRIIREVTREELQSLICDEHNNTGKRNIGWYNSGNGNVGSHNAGSYNVGYFNSGNLNSGDCNIGDYNAGNHNIGCHNSAWYNSGYYNSGSFNSGSCNTGNYNSGSYNSGEHNTGNRNTGDFNDGSNNAGSYNIGCFNTGIFNSNEPFMRSFNKPTNIRYSDFIKKIDYDFPALLKRISNNSLIEADIEKIKALPNFDAEIFREITGITIEGRR